MLGAWRGPRASSSASSASGQRPEARSTDPYARRQWMCSTRGRPFIASTTWDIMATHSVARRRSAARSQAVSIVQ